MSENPQHLEKLGDFLKHLEWHDYDYVPQPELPHGISPKDKPTKDSEAALEKYRLLKVKWRDGIESIRPGVVLFLRCGKFIVVGHVNENLTSKEHFEPDFDYEEILKIAYLW